MANVDSSIQSHYGSDGLTQRILAALEDAGTDLSNPTAETFFLADQLHGGGLKSTEFQAELAGVASDTRVLDAGCGIGGAARFLADHFGCDVDAIDLVAEFVETAKQLTALCGLDAKIRYRQGSVTDLPYPDQSFDLVWSQNVTMNIEDKPRMFAEVHRVLAPGGRFTLSHAVEGSAGGPYFPLPWAREPHYSFLGTEEMFLGMLEVAGFKIAELRYEGGAAGTSAMPPPAISAVMGPDFPERAENVRRSAQDGRIKGLLLVAERPA